MAKILLEIGCAPHAETCEGCELFEPSECCPMFKVLERSYYLRWRNEKIRLPACLAAEVKREEMKNDIENIISLGVFRQVGLQDKVIDNFLNKYANKEDK